jgi:hypothetical protein
VQQLHGAALVERRQLLLRLEGVQGRSLHGLAGQLLLLQTPHLIQKIPAKKSITWDRRYGFKNIFADKFSENIGVFDWKQKQSLKKCDHDIGI